MKTYFLGAFGVTFEEKIVDFIKNRTMAGTTIAKKINSKMVSNVVGEYIALMAKGFTPATFSKEPMADGRGGAFSDSTLILADTLSKKTNIDKPTVFEVLRGLYVLSKEGKIPFQKYNPKGYNESEKVRKSAFETEKNVFDKSVEVAGKSKMIIAVVGIAAAAYLLSQLRAFAPAPVRKA